MWDNKKIKNIIFDLGGVLFDINYRSTVDAYAKIGFLNFDEAYSQANQNKWFDDFEIGQISNSDLRNYLRTKLPTGISDEEMDKAWNAMLIGMPDFKFTTLSALQPHFKLFLLSNTNSIHLPEVKRMIELQTPGKRLEDYFIKTYYSNEIHRRKPDATTFQFVLDEQQLLAEETLFLDDSIQHIEGAASIGINTILITKENNTEQVFKDWIA